VYPTIQPGQTVSIAVQSTFSGAFDEANPANNEFCNTGQVYPYSTRFGSGNGAYDTSRFDNLPDPNDPHIDRECVTVEGTPDIWSAKSFVDDSFVIPADLT